MKVQFYAQSRQIVGCEVGELQVDQALTQDEFWSVLITAHPGLESLRKTARLARNESYMSEGEMVRPGDEIAVIPPVSGG